MQRLGVALVIGKPDLLTSPMSPHVKIRARPFWFSFQVRRSVKFLHCSIMFAALSVLDLLELLLTLVLPLKIIGSDGEPDEICRITAIQEWLVEVLFGDQ